MNVLLIDDDATFRFIAKMFTEKTGIVRITGEADNGQSGLDYLKNCLERGAGLPDAVLLDLNMPRMDGWEFLTHYPTVLNDASNIPVVILSSSINKADREKSETFSCVKGMFSKPLTEMHLREIRALVQQA